MGLKAQELVDGCFAKAADDEPLFVLRARDVIAPDVVRYWAHEARQYGVPAAKIAEAVALADRMLEWQKTRGSKVPD